MKRLKNSTKAIIISICVAVFAVAGVLTAVLLGRDKDKGGSNPPVTPPSPSAPAVVYSLTEEQKSLGLQVNESYKEFASLQKNTFYDLTSAQFTPTGLNLGEVKAYDGKYLVGLTDEGYSVFILENNSFVSLESKLASSSLLLNTNVSNVNILKVSGEFVIMSQTYTDQSTNFVDYHIVHLGETLSVSKTYHTTIVTNGEDSAEMLDGNQFIFTAFDSFFAVYTFEGEDADITMDLNCYEYVTDYSTYTGGYSLLDVDFGAINADDFEIGNYPISFNYYDGSTFTLYYSINYGFYTEVPTPSYDTVTTFADVSLYETGEYGSSKPNAIHVETQSNGYMISYTYEIKIGENEKVDFELDQTYSKISLIVATEDYFGVFAQNVDENKKLLDGGRYVYFDYEMNIIADYDAETNNGFIQFSAGNKYWTNEGVFAAESNVKLTKIFDFIEEGFTLDSVNYNYSQVIVSDGSHGKFVSAETLETVRGNYSNLFEIDEKYYFLEDGEGSYFYDETTGEIVDASLSDLVTSNISLMKNYSIYFLNNSTEGVDLYCGRTKLYSNVNNIQTDTNYVSFSVDGDYRALYLKENVNNQESEGDDSTGTDGDVEPLYYYDNQPIYNGCVENMNIDDVPPSERIQVDNHVWYSSSGNTIWVYFDNGYIPKISTVQFITIHRANTHGGRELKMPYYLYVSGGYLYAHTESIHYYTGVDNWNHAFSKNSYYHQLEYNDDSNSTHYDYHWTTKEGWPIKFTINHYKRCFNVSCSDAYVYTDGNSVIARFKFNVWGSDGNNYLTGLSSGYWNATGSSFNSGNSDYATRLSYDYKSHYVWYSNEDYVELLSAKPSSSSYYRVYNSGTIYLNRNKHSMYVAPYNSGYSYIDGGKLVGFTTLNNLTEYTSASNLYSTSTRTYSCSIEFWNSSLNYGESIYIDINGEGNAKYIFEDGKIFKTRHIYMAYEPIDITVKVVFKEGVESSEVPVIKAYRGKSSVSTSSYYDVKTITSNGGTFTIKFSWYFMITASSDHYNFSKWTVSGGTGCNYSGNYTMSKTFTRLHDDNNKTVTFTANWTLKGYSVQAQMWTKNGSEYQVYKYDEQTNTINLSKTKLNSTSSAPNFYLGGTATTVSSSGYISNIKSFDFRLDLTLKDIYDGNSGKGMTALDAKYKSVTCNGILEFYGWAFLYAYEGDAQSLTNKAFFYKSTNGDTTKDVDNRNVTIFAGGTANDPLVDKNGKITIVAVFKPKPFTVEVDYEDIGGSLELKNNKTNLALKTYATGNETDERVSNLYNDEAILKDYHVKIQRLNAAVETFVYDTGSKGNTQENLLCGDNILYQITLDPAYYIYKIVVSNYILYDKTTEKYYVTTLTLNYNRSTWSYSISSSRFSISETSSPKSYYFKSTDGAAENCVIAAVTGTNTVNLNFYNIMNPNGVVGDDSAYAIGSSGSSTITGKRGFSVKFYADSVTSNDNNVILNDATQTSSTINSNRYNNTALQLASQPLIIETNKKTAYFWYNQKKYYLISNNTSELVKDSSTIENFYTFTSNPGGSYTFATSNYSNFISQSYTSTTMICYLQRVYDSAGNINFNVIYPARRSGNSISSETSGKILNDYEFTDTISYNNTRILAISPYQSKVYESSGPSHKALGSYYEVKAYISGIKLGTSTIFSFNQPTRTLSGAGEMTFGYFNLNVSGNATKMNVASGSIFKYLGDIYYVHDAYKSTSGDYFLYFARRKTDHYSMYFLVYDRFYTGTVGVTDASSSNITINIEKLSYELVINDESDVNDDFSIVSSRVETKLNIYSALDNASIYNSAIVTTRPFDIDNATSDDPYEFYATNNLRLVFVPTSGYMIKSLALKVNGNYIFSFGLNTGISFDNLYRAPASDGNYYYTYTTVNSGVISSNLTYQMANNNVVVSDIANKTYFGCYYTFSGVNNWQTTKSSGDKYNANQFFVMISGIYGNVEIDVEMVSYTELIFEPESVGVNGLVGTLPEVENNYTTINLSSTKLDIFAIKNKGSSNPKETFEHISNDDVTLKLYTQTVADQNIEKGTLRVIFFGKASVIRYGLKIVASGETYSYAFKNGSFYLSPDTNAFECLDEYSGRTIGGDPINPSTREKTDVLVYMGMGTGTAKGLRDYFANYDINDYYNGGGNRGAFQTNEANTKFLMSVKVQTNNTVITTNAYLYNKNLEVVSADLNSYASSYTNGYSYKYKDDGGSKVSLYGSGFTDVQTYQLDNRTKSESWFNNTVLTNLNIVNGLNSVYWQDDTVYNKEGTGLKGNQETSFGYGLTYTYNEIPGYYLEYIAVNILEHGLLLFKVTDIIKTGTLSKNVNMKSFATNVASHDAHDQEQYTITVVYNKANSCFTINLYKKAVGGASASVTDNLYSVGILANNITVDFLSRTYQYRVIYNMFENVTKANGQLYFSSYDARTINAPAYNAKTGSYYQNIEYDTLTNLGATATMPGYTFIGWGSKDYYNYNEANSKYQNASRQQYNGSSLLTTWNSSSAWYSVADFFHYENRADLFELNTKYKAQSANNFTGEYLPGNAFYSAGSKFVTDTGFTSLYGDLRTTNTPLENYNFWTNYITSFMANVGNYTSYTSGLTPDWGTYNGAFKDVRNIELYGVWKANTYALKFELNTLVDQSSVYLNYNNAAEFKNTGVLLPNKLGFYDSSYTYYAYVTFDTNLWYVTRDTNYSYTASAISIAEGNMLKLIADRYGYSWLGWFSKGQSGQILQQDTQALTKAALGNLDPAATFASTYYNKMANPANQSTVPSFNYQMYLNNNLNDSLITNTFRTLDMNCEDDFNISYYNYSVFDTDSPYNATKFSVGEIEFQFIKNRDYLNLRFGGTENCYSEKSTYAIGDATINYYVAYYDTALSSLSYALDESKNLYINKDVGLRVFSLYSYWQTNAYTLIFDWQDYNNASSSLNHLGSTSTETLSISDTQGLKYHFFDTSLDTFLRGLVPYREGYDFIGWSFNYIPKESTTYSDKVKQINTPTSIFYLCQELFDNSLGINEFVATNYSNTLYSSNNRISGWSGETDWLLTNAGSEKLGNDWVNNAEEEHYVYIFALWTAQTFSINISLNVEKEELENLYEIDSDFALGLYHDNLSQYTGIASNNYKYDDVTFNDIVANIVFEIEFDQTFKNTKDDATDSTVEGAKVTFADKTFYIDDLFATSAGYYFLGLMIDNEYTNENSYLVKNTLKSIWGEGGLTNSYASGGVEFVGGDAEGPVLNHDLYHKLHVTNHKVKNDPATTLVSDNYKYLADRKTTSHQYDFVTYDGVDFVTENKIDATERTRYGSTNFGVLSFGGRNYYINSEVVETTNEGTQYYLYVLINGNRYYVVYYQYVSDAAGGSIDCITADRTFLYYNDAETGQKYKIRFAYNDDCTQVYSYYINENYANITNPEAKTEINLRFALYTERKNTVSVMTGAQASTIDTGLLTYQYDSGTGNYKKGIINWQGDYPAFTIANYTTRQFTLYAHWQNKNLDINLVNASASGVGTSVSNYGLSGYYNVQNTTSKKDVASENYAVSNRTDDKFETTTEMVETSKYTFNYYDSIQFLILPYFNGRYLSEMTLEFDDLREIVDTDLESNTYGSSTFAKIKRSITLKFQFNNESERRTVSLSANGVTSTFIAPSYTMIPEAQATNAYYWNNGDKVRYNGLYFNDYVFTQTSYLSIIDQQSMSYALAENGTDLIGYDTGKSGYGGGGFRMFEYLDLDENGDYIKMKNRTNVNALNFELNNIMSSVSVKCKFSVQTYQVNLYSVANQSGKGLEKTEDANEEHYYCESYKTLEDVKKDSNATAAKIPLLGAPYKSSSGYTRTNIATIKSDCSNVTSTSYNLPYGYYLYGIGYNVDSKPYRPIDSAAYPTDSYYGFYYLYGMGYYNFGATQTQIIGSYPGTGDIYGEQCSAALGSSQLAEAKGIRLTNLSSYSFSGWYEIDDSVTYTPEGSPDPYVVFNEYSKTDEATYINRNIDLYGYYYDSDNSKSVTFYYWDNDAEMYMIYTENLDIYTLSNSINTSGYKVDGDNILVFDNEKEEVERTTMYDFGSGEIEVSALNVYTKFGADREAFNDAHYTTTEIPGNQDDIPVLNSIVQTYWFYYVKYDFMYIDVGGVKYFAQEDSTNPKAEMTFCFVNQHNASDVIYPKTKIMFDGTERSYYISVPDGGGTKRYDIIRMNEVCKQGVYERDSVAYRYDYDFVGADLYVYHQSKYYKLEENTNSSINARYVVDILGKDYYLITNVNGYNSYTLYKYESGAFSQSIPISGYSIRSLKNYLVEYDEGYYPIVYPEFEDSQGSKYVNPYLYTKTNKDNINFINKLTIRNVEIVEGQFADTTLYFDYETGILYTDQEFVNKASVDKFGIYSPLNENFTMNVTNNGTTAYTVSTINVTKLPSSNSSEWYNDIRYGFVCYINVNDDIIRKISTVGETTGIWKTFRDYIYSTENDTFDGFEALALNDLNDNLVIYQDSQQFFTTFITVEEYEFAGDGKTIIKVVANLYVKFKFFDYTYDAGKGEWVKGVPIYVTLLCPYTFDVISDNTEVNESLYAIPIFAPYVIEFTKNSASKNGTEITIDVDKMEVSYFEVNSENVIVYNKANGNILEYAVLTETQFDELINAETGDYASNLHLLIKGGYCPTFDENNPTFDLNTIDISTETDGVYQDIYLLAFYKKDGKDYIVRVSDNAIKFNMTRVDNANSIVSTVIETLP